MLLALWIEKKCAKDEILEMYLKTCSYSHQVIGIHSASQHIFNKSLDLCTLAELAFLIALLGTPFLKPDVQTPTLKALCRQNYILFRLYFKKAISPQEYIQAKEENIPIFSSYKNDFQLNHFSQFSSRNYFRPIQLFEKLKVCFVDNLSALFEPISIKSFSRFGGSCSLFPDAQYS